MRILGAEWRPGGNILQVLCDCQKLFDHRADRWIAKCPHCGNHDRVNRMRQEDLDSGNHPGFRGK